MIVLAVSKTVGSNLITEAVSKAFALSTAERSVTPVSDMASTLFAVSATLTHKLAAPSTHVAQAELSPFADCKIVSAARIATARLTLYARSVLLTNRSKPL